MLLTKRGTCKHLSIKLQAVKLIPSDIHYHAMKNKNKTRSSGSVLVKSAITTKNRFIKFI